VVQVNSNGFNFPALSTTARVDAMPPSAPTNLIATTASRSISLKWTASQDNQAIARYEVLRNGTVIGSVISTSFLDANVNSKTSYTYQVRAVDASGQVSALSNAVRASTSRRK
jgi:chitin-binding protein